MTYYKFIVTFNFVGSGSDGCNLSEKRDETKVVLKTLETTANDFLIE